MVKTLGLGLALFAGLMGSAMACNPPPGLPIQQWYAMCGGEMQQAYMQGMGQGAPYDMFVNNVYRVYMANSMPRQMPNGPMASPMAGPQQCMLGAYQCFSGWARTCQQVGVGTMWITGAQRC